MKTFFTTSYYLWFVSRIILIILFAISLLSIYGLDRLTNTEMLVNTSLLFEVIIMGIITVQELSSKQASKILKIIAGGYMVIGGLALIITLFYVSKGSRSSIYLLGYPFGLWILLTGLFELYRIPKPAGNAPKNGDAR